MNTPMENAIDAAERAILARRDVWPCDDYEKTSRLIPLCVECGYGEAAHLDRAHEQAIDEDLERSA